MPTPPFMPAVGGCLMADVALCGDGSASLLLRPLALGGGWGAVFSTASRQWNASRHSARVTSNKSADVTAASALQWTSKQRAIFSSCVPCLALLRNVKRSLRVTRCASLSTDRGCPSTTPESPRAPSPVGTPSLSWLSVTATWLLAAISLSAGGCGCELSAAVGLAAVAVLSCPWPACILSSSRCCLDGLPSASKILSQKTGATLKNLASPKRCIIA
mmetsp:Transcript_20949/g.51058  ORF Transcript_20949/g.51058 Transcript_20949/m.51058 type:complete len:217 (-) Transcript_20949:398-1048(-)